MPSQPSQPTVSSLTVRTHETFIMRQLQDCYKYIVNCGKDSTDFEH